MAVFDPTKFVSKLSWRPSPMVGESKTAMQMHNNESRGYPIAEMEEKSTYFAPVALGLLAPGSWEPQCQDVEGSWRPQSEDVVCAGI